MADKLVFKVEGMSCSHCVARIKKALEALHSVKSTDISLENKTVMVIGSGLDAEQIIAVIEQAGYEAFTSS
jgi:copper chaperone CopZ